MVEIKDLGQHVGESVTIRGWVETTRGHGKVGFVVVRDGTGVVQGVVLKKVVDEATWEVFEGLTQESVVGLTGEVRAIGQIDNRAAEIRKMGFTRCLVPFSNLKRMPDVDGLELVGVKTVEEAIENLF